MKRIILFSISMILLLICQSVYAFDADRTDVFINGERVNFDIEPIIINGRTFVPARGICEKIGADSYWFEEEETVCIVKNDIKLFFGINCNLLDVLNCRDFNHYIEMYAGEIDRSEFENTVFMDSEPFIYEDRALIPIRYMFEALGAAVMWNSTASSVEISYSGKAADTPNKDTDFFDKCYRYETAARMPTDASGNKERVRDAALLIKCELRGGDYIPAGEVSKDYCRITDTKIIKPNSCEQPDVDCIVRFSAEIKDYDGFKPQAEYLIAFYKDSTCGIVQPYSCSFSDNDTIQHFEDKYNQVIYIPQGVLK